MRKVYICTVTLFALSLLALGTQAQAQVLTQEFETPGLTTLDVRNSSGNVLITASNDTKARVTAKKINFGPQCSLDMQRFGGTISVKVERAFSLVSSDCEVLLKISIPADTFVNAKAGAGNLTVEGTRGGVEFNTGTGNVVIDGEMGPVNGWSGSGNIRFAGSAKTLDLRTGSGDIKVELAQVPAEGSVKLASGQGNSTIKLPANAKFKADLTTGMGSINNAIPQTDNAKFVIRAQTGAGDVQIIK